MNSIPSGCAHTCTGSVTVFKQHDRPADCMPELSSVPAVPGREGVGRHRYFRRCRGDTDQRGRENLGGSEGSSIDMENFAVLSYPKLFHNLKAAIKEVCTEEKNRHIFYDDVAIPGDEMLEIVREKAFTRLPDYMQHVAADAYETLLHTRDGQLCDVMIDRATLDAVYAAGKASKAQIIGIMQNQRLQLQILRLQCDHRKPRNL